VTWPDPRGCYHPALVAIATLSLLLVGAHGGPSLADGPQVVPPGPVIIRVDAERPLRRISPLIYGVAAAGPEDVQATGARLNRWGGNPSSRYNWELGNAWNAARDWEFRNGNHGNAGAGDRQPSGVADIAATNNRSAGVELLLTVPALGWVARDDSTQTRSTVVPTGGGLPLADQVDAIAGYDPTANRAVTSIRSLPRKGAPFDDPPDLTDERVYQDEWVHHLVRRFGPASSGGVRFYAVDNEPDLWSETHTDVHPVQPGYDDLLATFLEYAVAIKDVDPDGAILGPALSGWTGYQYSPRDRGNDRFRTHADRRAHGDVPFLPWWLDQVRQHDERHGRRTLDYLDVHYYPQAPGVYSAASDDATNALRLRSTRALWDAEYADESWIREPVRLIPRLREWIELYYPGTRLAIGEWNWGADRTVNGALAIADVLGIFGREGVDLAAYWTYPPRGSPGALAFAIYTNYDRRGGAFGDLVLPITTQLPVDVGAYASLDSSSGDLIVIAINKRADGELPTTLQFDALDHGGHARLYRYSQDDPGSIRDLGELSLAGQALSLPLPPSSITLVRVARHR
jgi:hypothetical protein